MNAEPQPIETFSEEEVQPEKPRLAMNQNFKIFKTYLKKSYITIAAFTVMLLMFITSIIMTYSQNVEGQQQYSIMSLNPRVLIKLGANVGFSIKNGEIYRCVTPIFLHAGIQHFFVNSLTIFLFVLNVQKTFNKLIFFVAFFVGGLQGNLLSLFANFMNENENVASVGASTSICAIIGLNMASMYLVSLKNGTEQNAKQQMGTMIITLFIISMMPGVDFYGHLGSFIAGSLIGLSFSGLKSDYGEDSISIKKMKIIALIIYANYSIFLLSIFFV